MGGDAIIHVLVDASLLGTTGSGNFQFRRVKHVMSADASLAELMDRVVRSTTSQQLTVIDLSYSPAKLISSFVNKFTGSSGPSSKTLQSLGWFPSGTIAVLNNERNRQEDDLLKDFLQWQTSVLQEEEFAYNNPNTDGFSSDAGGSVQWTGVGASTKGESLKPSQIRLAVESRADSDNVKYLHQKRPTKNKRSEKERTQRLDVLLGKLDNKSNKKKKKAVSGKVRTMLIKSRSEGNKKLRMEDRLHLEILRVYDLPEDEASNTTEIIDSNRTNYRFFSRQTTAGRVASAVAPNLGSSRAAEFLVSYAKADSNGSAPNETGEKRRGQDTKRLDGNQFSGIKIQCE